MWRYSYLASSLLSALLMLWCCADGVDSKPLFGLLGLFGGSNRTSLAGELLQIHLQQKISALDALANAISFAGNSTAG